MCVVSMVGDHFGQKWDKYWPQQWIYQQPIVPNEDIEKLKEEVKELRELLKRALDYDKKNNEPHCEVESKMEKLKAIADIVGISLDDLLKK